jgi:hypothetical protein
MNELDKIIEEYFPEHPFSNIPETVDYQKVLSNLIAYSQAFPYLQAGSQKDIFFHYLEKGEEIPKHVEYTSVVGNFLCWDETGGLYATLVRGLKGLPNILDTDKFHSNILKKDCRKLFNKEIYPEYSQITKEHLIKLYNGLSSLCPVTRTAYMVSFESHAERLITALWESLTQKFKVSKNSLSYFFMHVGGEKPAEFYHVEMTRKLIEKTTVGFEKDFLEKFKQAYSFHFNWCKDIIRISNVAVSQDSA